MELTKQNYFSVDANMEYMGATQFKDFMKCESEGLAKANGTVVEEPTKPMLVGSYVDAYFSGELDEFKANNPQILKKDGTLLKDFEQANDIIKAIEEDEMMMEYLNGVDAGDLKECIKQMGTITQHTKQYGKRKYPGFRKEWLKPEWYPTFEIAQREMEIQNSEKQEWILCSAIKFSRN